VTSSALSAPTVAELERLRAIASSGAAGGLAPQDFDLPAQTDGGGDGTIQLELLSTGTFTEGERGGGGHRYLYATYRVRNAQKNGTPYDTPRKNLTFYAVSTTTTLHHTPISKLLRFDGGDAAEELAAQLMPTGAVAKDATTDSIFPINPDVLQALTEEEADAIGALAGEGIEDVFPYGFVVRRRGSTTTRELPANPEPEQFDGIVTFAYRVPLQATPADDPFTVSILFLAVDDDEVKITQSLEEQTLAGREAFAARAASLGADKATVLAGRLFRAGNATRQICSLRTAGPLASPTQYLVNARPPTSISISPDPYALDGSASFIGRNAQLEVTADVPMEVVSQNAFSVRGTQSGPHFPGGSIDGDGTTRLTTSPAAFFPGEEVEVVIGQELVECPVHPPQVIRYRVATTGGPGSFVVDTTYTLVTVPIGYPTTPWSLALGDRDGDGHLDVVAANEISGNISVLLNQGDGSFGSHATFGEEISSYSVTLGDMDGDGDLDIVVVNSAGFLTPSHTVSVYLNK